MNLIQKQILGNKINILYDTDAQAYILASGITSLEAKDSVNYLIVNLKSNSLWNKIQAIYPFKGTTSDQHKFNAKNPVDTDAGFRLTFNGTANYSNSGYTPNGSNGYANSHFIPSGVQSVNSNGITVVTGTNGVLEAAFEVGSGVSGFNSYVATGYNKTSLGFISRLNDSRIDAPFSTTGKGIYTSVKQSSSVTSLFTNGVKKVSGSSGGGLSTYPVFVGAINSGGTPAFTDKRIQMVLFHEGLSDAEVSTLHSIIDLSETIAGRKTW